MKQGCSPWQALPDGPESDEGYGWALDRNRELEVDLASAVAGLKQSQSANAALREVCSERERSCKQLEDQHARLRGQLRQEQKERQHLVDEQQQQVSYWRAQFEAKARENEHLQAKLNSQGELSAIRMQVVEEFAEPYDQKLKEQKQLLLNEQRKTAEANRQAELQKIQHQHREEEFQDEMAEQARKHRVREQALEKRVAALEADVKNAAEENTALSRVRAQLKDAEAKTAALQRALKEQEQQSEKEHMAAAEDLRNRVEETGALRNKAHELKVQLEQEQHRGETLQADCEKLQRESAKLATQLEQEKARNLATASQQREMLRPAEEMDRLHAEMAKLRGVAAEREHLAQRVKTAEEQHQVANASAGRAEARLRQLEEDQREREREAQADREEAEKRLKAELTALYAQLDNAEREKDTIRSSAREREAALAAQLDSATSRIDALTDDVSHLQAGQDELETRLRDERRDMAQKLATAKVEQELREEVAKKEQEHREEAAKKEQEHREAAHRKKFEHRKAAHQKELEHLELVSQQERDKMQADMARQQEKLEAQIAAKEAALSTHEAAAKAHATSQAAQHDAKLRDHEAAKEELLRNHGATTRELTERIEQLQREGAEGSNAREALSAALRKQEQRADALQAELVSMSARLDEERSRWVKDADTAHADLLLAEEKRRADATARLQDECSRQLQKQQQLHKRALSQVKRKRQGDKSQIMDLVKRVSQAQQERNVAVRVCEENTAAYQQHISQLAGATAAVTSSYAPRTSHSAVPVNRSLPLSPTVAMMRSESPLASNRHELHELRAISERLDKHVEWLRNHGGGAVGLSTATTAAGTVVADAGSESPMVAASRGSLSHNLSSTWEANTPRPILA